MTQPPTSINRTLVFRTVNVLLLLSILGSSHSYHYLSITSIYFYEQDGWLLMLLLVLFVLALLPVWPGPPIRRLALPRGAVWAIGIGALLFCYAGHYWLLCGYDLSRDEQMAVFDSRIFAARHLVWPLPPAWMHDSAALNLTFIPPVSHPYAWVSFYLPFNAALRGWLGLVIDPVWAGPLYVAGSVALIAAIARRLFPDPAGVEPRVVALATLAFSGQALMAGMTAYAMPAHLFFDLLWLWLFLHDRPATDTLAVPVGFIATGLHQPLFHPLFVAPFIALMLWQRRWGRAGAFSLAYAGISAFWLWWPHYTATLIAAPGPKNTQMIGTLATLRSYFSTNHDHLPLMAFNLLRFCTWQALPTLPLLIAGFCAAVSRKKPEPMALALAAGFLAPVVAMTIIAPYQGHGFGYRYIHSVLGNAALLCGYGWRWLAARQCDGAQALRTCYVRALALSALVLLPLQAWMARDFYRPYAEASARINATRADYALINGADAPYAIDLVLNRPDLGNRPLRLSASDINDADAVAARLCHGRRPMRLVWVLPSIYTAITAYYGQTPGQIDPHVAKQAAAFAKAGCQVIALPGKAPPPYQTPHAGAAPRSW